MEALQRALSRAREEDMEALSRLRPCVNSASRWQDRDGTHIPPRILRIPRIPPAEGFPDLPITPAAGYSEGDGRITV